MSIDLLTSTDDRPPRAATRTGVTLPATTLGASTSTVPSPQVRDTAFAVMAHLITSALSAHRRRVAAAAASKPMVARNAFD